MGQRSDPRSERRLLSAYLVDQTQAERVPDWVAIDPAPVVAARQALGSELQNFHLRGGEIINADIKVHLLRYSRIRPARRDEILRLLESDAGPIRGVPNRDPVVGLVQTLHAKQLLVERSESRRVGAVNDEAVPVSDHGQVLSGPSDILQP